MMRRRNLESTGSGRVDERSEVEEKEEEEESSGCFG